MKSRAEKKRPRGAGAFGPEARAAKKKGRPPKRRSPREAAPVSFFEIRAARPGDEKALSALLSRLFSRALSIGPGHEYLLAFSGRRLAGFAHLRPKAGHVYLQGLGVHPSFRGHGVGTRLLEASLRWAAERRPASPLRLKVKAGNQPALRLYARQGFQLSRNLGGAYLLSRREPN